MADSKSGVQMQSDHNSWVEGASIILMATGLLIVLDVRNLGQLTAT